jgi:hypothetical protein
VVSESAAQKWREGEKAGKGAVKLGGGARLLLGAGAARGGDAGG